MANLNNIQLPVRYDVIGYDGKISNAWALWFTSFVNSVNKIALNLNADSFVYTDNNGQLVSAPSSDGQLLIGRAGNTPIVNNLTGGNAINVSTGPGQIVVTNTGVTSITGNLFQISVSSNTGNVSLSLPQNIDTSANVTFSTGNFNSINVSTPITVTNGGTGRSTLTSHGVLVGEGTGAINQTSPGVTGSMLLGVTGADPQFGNNPIINGGTIDNTIIGNVTPAAGSFTTLSASALITPSSNIGIAGTITNDNVQVGSIGEFNQSFANAISISSNTVTNITSIVLTAGDWEVAGTLNTNPNVLTTTTDFIVGVGSVSATLGSFNTLTNLPINVSAGQNITASTPQVRFSLSGTTTIYLISKITFATSTMTVDGYIKARRIR